MIVIVKGPEVNLTKTNQLVQLKVKLICLTLRKDQCSICKVPPNLALKKTASWKGSTKALDRIEKPIKMKGQERLVCFTISINSPLARVSCLCLVPLCRCSAVNLVLQKHICNQLTKSLIFEFRSNFIHNPDSQPAQLFTKSSDLIIWQINFGCIMVFTDMIGIYWISVKKKFIGSQDDANCNKQFKLFSWLGKSIRFLGP